MASGQGSHLLSKSPICSYMCNPSLWGIWFFLAVHLCVTHLSGIFVNFFFKHIYAAAKFTQ